MTHPLRCIGKLLWVSLDTGPCQVTDTDSVVSPTGLSAKQLGGAMGVWVTWVGSGSSWCVNTKNVSFSGTRVDCRGGRERRDGEGEGKSYVKSHAIVHLEGKGSSAFIIWRRTARLPGGRVGSTPNESASRT